MWTHQIDNVVLEITRQASPCKVKLLDPGIIEAVLHDNESVCCTSHSRAFNELREAPMMGFLVREKACEQLRPIEVDERITTIRERVEERFGGRLGGPAGTAEKG